MIKLLGSALFLICILTSFITFDLNSLREKYNKVASDKELCQKLMLELADSKNSSATHLAYLGALQTIWANHVFSPIKKLSTFNEGKKNIEKAIHLNPNDTELRFIRLSIQKNAPAILGYKSNIDEDVLFIKNNRKQINSSILNKNIDALLKN